MIYWLRVRGAVKVVLACAALVPVTFLVELALTGALQEQAMIPLLLAIPTVAAGWLVAANSPPNPELEQIGARPVRQLSLGYTIAGSLLLVAGLAPAASHGDSPWGLIAVVRNVSGLVGVAAVLAGSIGPRLAWIGPIAVTGGTVTAAAGGVPRSGWAWLLAVDSDTGALVIGLLLFVAGMVTMWVRAPFLRGVDD